MTLQEAQIWLVKASLGATAVTFLFFCIAPVVGYPLDWGDAIRILEILLPPFLGYLGSATQHVFANSAAALELGNASPLLPLLVRGPVIVFALASAGAIAAFGISNAPSASHTGTGMSVDVLAAVLAIALGLLTVTTSAIVARVFVSQKA